MVCAMSSSPRPATPAWPPKSAPRLFVSQEVIAGGNIILDGPQAHYLLRVMRVVEGAVIIVCDDISGEWACEVTATDKRSVTLTAVEKLRDREAVPDFWLCPALLKKDRFDIVLEKATELGVARILPILTHRCVATKLNLDRAKTLTTEAAEQCARTALPQVQAPQKLAALLRDWPTDRALFFADETGGDDCAQAFRSSTGPAALLIGPEGGFDESERAAIRSARQARAIGLGPRILRGETAAVAATALWMALAGDWASE